MNSLRKYLLQVSSILTLCFISVLVQASPVLKLKLEGDFSSNYDKVSQALENNRFYVVFEPNIGGSISSFKERWGEDYNRNGFEEIRSLVFCNPWYVNQVINKDPEMAALCPLSVTLLHKENTTQLMFLRPSKLKSDSPAQGILLELESDIEKALRESGAK